MGFMILFILIQCLPFIVVLSFFVFFACRAKKFAYKNKLPKTLNSSPLNREEKDINSSSFKQKNDYTYCDYCGAKIEKFKKRCSSCGAKLNN